jgi:redox-regulated HSP33 family molecular chaperone
LNTLEGAIFAIRADIEALEWVNWAAMLIQKMPESKAKDSEDWHRIATLANTITDKEMCELDMASLLHRLFHEEVLEVFLEWVNWGFVVFIIESNFTLKKIQ